MRPGTSSPGLDDLIAGNKWKGAAIPVSCRWQVVIHMQSVLVEYLVEGSSFDAPTKPQANLPSPKGEYAESERGKRNCWLLARDWLILVRIRISNLTRRQIAGADSPFINCMVGGFLSNSGPSTRDGDGKSSGNSEKINCQDFIDIHTSLDAFGRL